MRGRPISAVVITLNEAENIGRCLDSLAGVADEIIVADSGSTDATIKIAEAKGAKVLHQDWLGFAGQKNWANALAAHDLILSLDADEELSPELVASIRAARSDDQTDAWSFHRRTNYCGKWIRYTSWHPDVKIRLFDRRKARWEGDYVHETLKLDEGAKVGKLSGDCNHYTTKSLEQHAKVVDRFTTLKAKEMQAKGKRATFIHLVVKPPVKFFVSFFIKRGFLDGWEGFLISKMNAYATFLKYAKLKQLNRGRPGD